MSRPKLAAVPDPDSGMDAPTSGGIVAALDGSSRDILVAMRLTLATQIDSGNLASNAIASAFKELRELDRLIRAADAEASDKGAAGDGDHADEDFDAAGI